MDGLWYLYYYCCVHTFYNHSQFIWWASSWIFAKRNWIAWANKRRQWLHLKEKHRHTANYNKRLTFIWFDFLFSADEFCFFFFCNARQVVSFKSLFYSMEVFPHRKHLFEAQLMMPRKVDLMGQRPWFNCVCRISISDFSFLYQHTQSPNLMIYRAIWGITFTLLS